MSPVVARVYVSRHGNVFMREIAEHLAEATGATVVTDELPPLGSDPLDHLVVAPHEFFPLFPAASEAVDAAAAHSVCVNTEQDGTPFFELAVRYARLGPLAFDINPFSLASMRRRGLAAVHLPLGYVASMDRWHRRANERHVDIALLAARTPRREQFLGGAAGQLWEWRCALRMFAWHKPILGGGPAFLAGDAKYDALADTRILLNVHRSEDPYFEWARVIEAIANGCLVVTETSTGTEPLIAGEHFVAAPLEYLAEQAVALAHDEPRRRRIADAAYDALRTDLDQGDLVRAALAAGRQVAGSGHGDRWRPAVPTEALGRAVDSVRRALRPSSSAAAETEELRKVARSLKGALLRQVAHTRTLEREVCRLTDGSPDPVTVTRTPAWDGATPTVSVVVPLFEQGQFLDDAVDSVVAASARVAVELIVVDDHSGDDAADVAAGLLAARPWLPAMLIRRATNGGLSVARNTALDRARAPYVLPLDADNALYPSGIATLLSGLQAAGGNVVATYGILERFDETGSVGVTSHLPWDVDLLVQGAYVDAMALWRRSALHALGGYEDPPGIGGWEDYDLWLRAAERGQRAELVPAIVGRYREHAGSMRRISDIDMLESFVTLRERHPRLPWPS